MSSVCQKLFHEITAAENKFLSRRNMNIVTITNEIYIVICLNLHCQYRETPLPLRFRRTNLASLPC